MDDFSFLWDGFRPILRIFLVGTVTFAWIIMILRFSGKRSLTRMNAFDFIITVTIGSAFGRILTATEVSLSESAATFLLLAGLQYAVSFFEIRSNIFNFLITTPPALLFHKGKFIEKNMLKERIRQSDLLGAVRKAGFQSLDQVEAIVLESEGSFSIIKKVDFDSSSFQNIINEK
ncbi:MAG: DUF421 domain-containing protein [Cytophagaceae bacterium]